MPKRKHDIRDSYHFKPRHPHQVEALKCLNQNTLAFLTGPSGVAKTFLATAWAVRRHLNDESKIQLTRPAIQQGAKIGFLPGSAEEKTSPFLAPVYNAIEKIMGDDARVVKRSAEILPLSLIRGHTIEDSTLIVDEAQNLSLDEIKTICTRIGQGGRIIFCGDVEQNDLSGAPVLQDVAQMLAGIQVGPDRIGSYQFTEESIVRHPLISRILGAFRDHDSLAT